MFKSMFKKIDTNELKKYAKLHNSLYEVKTEIKNDELLTGLLKTQPTMQEFEEFCEAFGIDVTLEKISVFCPNSKTMRQLILKSQKTLGEKKC